MLQASKIIQSRNDWKDKAVKRATEIREYRKTQARNKDSISELKAQLKASEKTTVGKKNS